MNIITAVNIKGLWGSNDVTLNLHDKTNFIIGVNGTGKTTIINLLAATLTLDVEKLLRLEFDSIEVKLKEIGGNKKPSIKVIKGSDVNEESLRYEIKNSAKESPISISIDMRYERFISDMTDNKGRVYRRKLMHNDFNSISNISSLLEVLIKTSWLSVNRADNVSLRDSEKKSLTTIDHKILDLNNELVRYFSLLSQQFSAHALEFQKKSFLAVINNEGAKPIFNFASTIDIDSERQTLIEVFEMLGVENRYYAKKLNDHFVKLEKVKKLNTNQAVSIDDFSIMYNSWRAHTLVADYEVLQTKKIDIFEPRRNFIELLNSMFSGRKIFTVSDKNELIVMTKDKRTILLEDLSSGEKQLLIILGEALLQNNQSVIYIADEPELSLHVIWQEQLTGAISKLNPNAQIIFATHSPDIVGRYQDNILDMESLLS